MGFLAAFYALIILMTPATTIDLGGVPQGLHGESYTNVGGAGDNAE